MTIGLQYAELTAAELAAVVSAGVLDWSGTATLDTTCGTAGFYVADGLSADGPLQLWYDQANQQLKVIERGVVTLTTTALNLNPASPTFQNWSKPARFDWRLWDDTSDGTGRARGLRVAVNGCAGGDTVSATSGAPLAALTQARVLARAGGAWAPMSSILAGSKSANVAARGVILCDSIGAPRGLLPAIGTFFNTIGVVASLAQGGATVAAQTATWQASRYRGDLGVLYVVGQLSINDLAAGTAPATILANLQTLATDVKTNNPWSKFILAYPLPARFYLQGLSGTYYGNWQTVVAGIPGLANVDRVVDTTSLGDGNNTLLYQIDSLHTTDRGRELNAALLVAGVVAEGVTP
jgi:hypothetical protein